MICMQVSVEVDTRVGGSANTFFAFTSYLQMIGFRFGFEAHSPLIDYQLLPEIASISLALQVVCALLSLLPVSESHACLWKPPNDRQTRNYNSSLNREALIDTGLDVHM